jgi:hypothetical protein
VVRKQSLLTALPRCARPKPAETRDDFESTPRDIKTSKNNYLRWRREQDSNPRYAKQNTRYFKWSTEIVGRGAAFLLSIFRRMALLIIALVTA